MCPKQGLGSCQKKFCKFKANDKVAFFSLAEKWVLLSASAREPEEREFVVDSGASMHMVSEKNLNSAELKTMRTSRSPTRCEQIKKRRFLSNNWTFSTLLCFFKNLPQCFHWGNSAKNMGTRITGKAV